MQFDWKQQIKSYVVGAVVAWAAKQFGMDDTGSVAVGVIVGGAVDLVYWLILRSLHVPQGDNEE